MFRLVLKKVLFGVLTAWTVVTLTFILVRISGNPAALMVSDAATPADIEAIRISMGLDQSLWQQYAIYISKVVTGDLGDSFFQMRPAAEVVLEQLPATLQLAVPSFLLGIAVAVGMVLMVQLLNLPWLRKVLLAGVLLRESIPVFFFAWIMILVFSVRFGLFPTGGRGTWQSLVLPVATLSTLQIAIYFRLLNEAFGAEQQKNYVRAAQAFGLSRRRIAVQYILPNAVLPVLALAGLHFAVLLSGTVVTETVFSWPGLGRTLVGAVERSDFAIVQAAIVFIAVVFSVANLLVDVLTFFIDPRTRD